MGIKMVDDAKVIHGGGASVDIELIFRMCP